MGGKPGNGVNSPRAFGACQDTAYRPRSIGPNRTPGAQIPKFRWNLHDASVLLESIRTRGAAGDANIVFYYRCGLLPLPL